MGRKPDKLKIGSAKVRATETVDKSLEEVAKPMEPNLICSPGNVQNNTKFSKYIEHKEMVLSAEAKNTHQKKYEDVLFSQQMHCTSYDHLMNSTREFRTQDPSAVAKKESFFSKPDDSKSNTSGVSVHRPMISRGQPGALNGQNPKTKAALPSIREKKQLYSNPESFNVYEPKKPVTRWNRKSRGMRSQEKPHRDQSERKPSTSNVVKKASLLYPHQMPNQQSNKKTSRPEAKLTDEETQIYGCRFPEGYEKVSLLGK